MIYSHQRGISEYDLQPSDIAGGFQNMIYSHQNIVGDSRGIYRI